MKKWFWIPWMGLLMVLSIITLISLGTFQSSTPSHMDFVAFEHKLNAHPTDVKTVWYSTQNPTMGVQMVNGKKYEVDSPMTPDFRLTLLKDGVHLELEQPLSQTSVSSAILSALGNYVPMILIVGVLIYSLWNQRSQTKLSIQFQQPSSISTRMKDVAGVDHARQDLEEIISFLKAPARFEKVGAKMPKGVLLSGPPGTGKTLLAKAIAGEAGVPFTALSGSDFVEKYVGVGASRVRELFDEARKKAPCIVFIDEIDALGRRRGGGGNSEYDHALNQLLVEMNGFTDRTGIVVIAATNRPDGLDTALVRPGRFDRQITVGLPDIEARAQILRVHARNRRLSDEVRSGLDAWAKRTTFMSGAELENLMNEAALCAVRRNHEAIEPKDMEDAYNRVVAGGEKHGKRQERDTRVTAWHEAGHAILGALYGREVPRVTIVPTNNGAGGYTLINPVERMQTKQEMLEELQILMGGRIAEELTFGKMAITGGASGDLKRATEIATTMVCSYGMSEDAGFLSTAGWVYQEPPHGVQAGVNRLLQDAYEAARGQLMVHQEQLDALAHALLETETLVETELSEYLSFPETSVA